MLAAFEEWMATMAGLDIYDEREEDMHERRPRTSRIPKLTSRWGNVLCVLS
jgi:hypothetical protein